MTATTAPSDNLDVDGARHGGPRRVAILGAGPIGMDAALACAEAGWPCTVYESGPTVAGNVRGSGHVRLFTPWSMNLSHRMRRHLAAAGMPVPEDAAFPTGAEFTARLLEPVAALPALAGVVRTGVRVLGVTRHGLLKHEQIGVPERGHRPFRLLLTGPHPYGPDNDHGGDGRGGREWVEQADLVLDCTGTYGGPNALGDGGIPAPGETGLHQRIVRRIPDLRAEREAWAGRTVLLVGAGKSAQTAARDLAGLVAEAPATRVVWAVRDPAPDWGRVHPDPLPQRQELVEVAEALRGGAVPGVQVRTGIAVEGLRPAGDRVAVTLRSSDGGTEDLVVDRVLALTGYVGDTGLYRQLQVHECYATAAPMNLSAALLAAAGDGPADCLAQPSQGVEVLRSPEPDFFVLGVKSYGRNPAFLLRVGYEQVDEVVGAYTPQPAGS